MSNAVYLVVTDLDGSLLDHHSYSYAPAAPTLAVLEQMRLPVVLASSKTRAEMLVLRAELGNEHPFIVENGAAVLVPRGYFPRMPDGCIEQGDYWLHELTPRRSHWLALLDQLRPQYGEAFEDFASAGIEGIVAMTGLDVEAAARANEREYTEPVQWRADETQLASFLQALADGGATVLRGGRFYSIGGDSDKGRALRWLREQYALAAGGGPVYDLAIGDGQNDAPMLEVAHDALLIPAPERPLPVLERTERIRVGRGLGPEAWAQGVQAWLRELYSLPEEV